VAEPGNPAQWAKGALRRLAQAQQEPTPAHYARAYAEESGQPEAGAWPPRARALLDKLAARATDDPALRQRLAAALADARWDELQHALDDTASRATSQGRDWAELLDRMALGLERSHRGWTAARKKESLQRVLQGSGSDMARLQQRLKQLVASWDSGGEADAPPALGDAAATPGSAAHHAPAGGSGPASSGAGAHPAWAGVVRQLQGALGQALPPQEPRATELANELAGLADRIARDGATAPLVAEVQAACERARRLLAHRHHLLDELGTLCRHLADSLAELAEDDSWARGQTEQLRQKLAGTGGVSARGVRAATELLHATREHQRGLRGQRDEARDALKAVIGRLLGELAQLDAQTGDFNARLGGHADAIERADSLPSLAALVRELVGDTRAVQQLVSGTRARLHSEHTRATELEQRVRNLEGELRRLSDEVHTDALTQVANRRGMQQAFDAEAARVQREGSLLAVGLIDIDNFKKLNDTLGHAAGDEALKALAAQVKAWLRPVDHVARFGGEEFVVLLPATPVDEAQQVLTRLQRQLSASLFKWQGKDVFVTFSAGVSAWRPGEPLDAALERADEGLYEAKRTGKNKTCVA
jgi:diguanylate cyclase